MANFLQFVSSLREQMHATLSRSDILRPLIFLIGVLTTTTVALIYAGGPDWITKLTAYSLLGVIGLYVFTYIFCLFWDRDALRSESYSLHKMAIEHGYYGDSEIGLIKIDEKKPEQTRLIDQSTPVSRTGDGE